jgi:hypothetical protein
MEITHMNRLTLHNIAKEYKNCNEIILFLGMDNNTLYTAYISSWKSQNLWGRTEYSFLLQNNMIIF